jgi:periplasmic protein TonB
VSITRQWITLLAAGAATLMLVGVSAASSAMAGYTPPSSNVGHTQAVKYPMDAQRAGEEGTVAIKVFVGANGKIRAVRMLKSSGFDRLDNAALESVLAWEFKPATQDGKPVSGWVTVQLVYKVPGPDAAVPASQ